MAALWPGAMVDRWAPWLSNPRARTGWSSGKRRRWVSAATLPLQTVPVTTVPVPFTVNARSMGMRKRSSRARSGMASTRSRRTLRSISTPSPEVTDVSTTGAPSSGDPRRRVATSSCTSAIQSSSCTRSRLVSATTPFVTPNRVRMARCSRVCGMTPSSAAMTSNPRSTPVAPASMVRMKASWPGTSTIPTVAAWSRASGAKPSSIVMPRRFSSGRRSVSTPVSARTSEVLP